MDDKRNLFSWDCINMACTLTWHRIVCALVITSLICLLFADSSHLICRLSWYIIEAKEVDQSILEIKRYV